MNLYEYLMAYGEDVDAYDDVFDASVTACVIEDEEDDYDRFCNNLFKHAEVVGKTVVYGCPSPIVAWAKLISDNMEKFKDFSKEHWIEQYEDDDDFIYEWIKELHLYCAGYVNDSFYKVLNEFIDTLE